MLIHDAAMGVVRGVGDILGSNDMTKYRGYVTVDVDVDIDEVLSELSDADLLEALAERNTGASKEPPVSVELIEGAYEALMRGDTQYAKLQLEQYLFPKFKTLADCVEKYKSVPRRASS